MRFKSKISFFFITILIGFMLAVQFNSNRKADTADTKDMWEIRERYIEEKELESELLKEIRKNEEKIAQYEAEIEQSKEQIFHDTLTELQEEAGLTEKKGPGIVITILPVYENYLLGEELGYVSPDLLRKLVNELNMYGARDISIADQRIINTTSIRDIQGETKIDGYPIRSFPLEIKVIADNIDNANILYNSMQISNIPDQFYIDNLKMHVSEVREEITVPASHRSITVKELKTVVEKGGK